MLSGSLRIFPLLSRASVPARTYAVEATVAEASNTKDHPFITDRIATQLHRHWTFSEREESPVQRFIAEVLSKRAELEKAGVDKAELQALQDEWDRQLESDTRMKLALGMMDGSVKLPENAIVKEAQKLQQAGKLDEAAKTKLQAKYDAAEKELAQQAQAAGPLEAELYKAAQDKSLGSEEWLDKASLDKVIDELSPDLQKALEKMKKDLFPELNA